MRLDKFLSNLKYGSRTEIKELVKKGLIKVNSKIIKKSDVEINPVFDLVSINEKNIFYKENIILAMYKPIGYLSANQDNLHPVALDLIKEPYSRFDLKIAGRLDLDAEGLLIITNNGALVHAITNPKKHLDKVYEVTLDNDFNELSCNELLNGVELVDVDKTIYNARAIKLTFNRNNAIIVIDEGKFHQVKKMFMKVGFKVINLKRVQIGKLKLDLKPGEYKEVTEEEIF